MTFGITAAAVATVGVGLSAASAAGAFGGSVDSYEPTPEELAAASAAREVYGLGRQIQNPLDRQARRDLVEMRSPYMMASQAGLADSQAVGQLMPGLQQAQAQAMMTSGGPGSGRWAAGLGASSAMLDAARRQAQAQGRLGGVNQYLTRAGQYLDRRTQDLDLGLQGMTTGGKEAATALSNRIQAQVANKVAANQAMGQLGGSLIGAGMGMFGAAGNMAGGAAGALNGAETGRSFLQPALQSAAAGPYRGIFSGLVPAGTTVSEMGNIASAF